MSTKKQPVVDEMQDKTKAYQQDKLEYIKSPVVLEFLGLPEDTSLAESKLETAIINTLAKSDIQAYAKADAPGVYGKNDLGMEAKLASLGLRIRKGCSFHGLALNINMDMTPFLHINPCGYAGMAMTQTSALGGPQSVAEAQAILVAELASLIGYQTITNADDTP